MVTTNKNDPYAPGQSIDRARNFPVSPHYPSHAPRLRRVEGVSQEYHHIAGGFAVMEKLDKKPVMAAEGVAGASVTKV
jgi:hypothetical protein